MYLPFFAMPKPALICRDCWSATPAHPLVRNFIAYCSHLRVLAMSGALPGCWDTEQDVRPDGAAQAFEAFARRLPEVCGASMRTQVDEAVGAISRFVVRLRAQEAQVRSVRARIWS